MTVLSQACAKPGGGVPVAPSPLRAGLSLVELVIGITVMGLLASVAAYSVANTTRVAREQTAFSRAEILDAARVSYALSRSDAGALWAATPLAQRQALLAGAGMLSAPGGYLVVPGGYELRLAGALQDRTEVWTGGRALAR